MMKVFMPQHSNCMRQSQEIADYLYQPALDLIILCGSVNMRTYENARNEIKTLKTHLAKLRH